MVEDKIKHLEKQFNYYYDLVREASSYLFEDINNSERILDNDEKNYSEHWTHEYLSRMYNILCVYFETLGLSKFLKVFNEEFENVIKDQTKATEISSVVLKYGDTYEDLSLLIEWKKFLAPFDFFFAKENEKEKKRIIPFLESTNEILKLTKTDVYKEEDINSIIREVAKLYFTGVIGYSEGYFTKPFKKYRPDVIIKELGIAIEYKLVRSDGDTGNKLDELITDAKRYTENHHNKECIAVFCLSTKVKKTKKEIKEEWNNMDFPKNWTLVIVSDVNVKN